MIDKINNITSGSSQSKRSIDENKVSKTTGDNKVTVNKSNSSNIDNVKISQELGVANLSKEAPLDLDKVSAIKTRINVKHSGEIKGNVRYRDIEGTDKDATSFIYFFVTVYTNNMYETMRHAEEVITSSIKYHFNGEDTGTDREIEDSKAQVLEQKHGTVAPESDPIVF